jgi:predicted metal-binding protein
LAVGSRDDRAAFSRHTAAGARLPAASVINVKRSIAPVRLQFSDTELQEDLERYRQEAVRLGATDAKVVLAGNVTVDERVALKCRVPLCFGYGTSANCPPNAPSPAEIREIVKKYSHAIFFKVDVPPTVIVRNRETILERAGAYKKVFELVSAIESLAFYDGHYLAVGFAAGSCKSTYCHKAECAVLKGNRCRNELRSRPSMEAVGIDAYRMATEAGWDIYPIGSDCKPEDVPGGTLLGLVLVL